MRYILIKVESADIFSEALLEMTKSPFFKHFNENGGTFANWMITFSFTAGRAGFN